jgi:esterase FrsA
MNDVDELKRFVVTHARAQNLRRADTERLLGRIRTDDPGGAGSWAEEWCRAADLLERDGRYLDACRHYNIARFPYVDGLDRQQALDRCVRTFDRWRTGHRHIERLDVDVDGGLVRCWTTGLSTTRRLPVLLVLGGIVSIKEQWAPVLLQARRLGMAGVVTELPGVGENTTRYTPQSWRMLSAVLDAVSDRADVARTYAVALSFSGHLALRCAVDDRRIRGIVTAGAPVREFFTDPGWQRDLPRVTVDTLAHLAGTAPGRLPGDLAAWALRPDQLAALDIPVGYIASRHDEIIPAADVRLLERQVRRFRLVEHDDVHGSPRHVTESRLWTVLSIMRMQGVHNAQRAAVSGLWHGLRARDRLLPRAVG